MKILVIEDEAPKLNALSAFFEEFYPVADIAYAKSLSSAINTISEGGVDIAIIDMSLPTYDFEVDRRGGSPQGNGGRDILRFIESESPSTIAAVVTQYDGFENEMTGGYVTLADLERELFEEFGAIFIGAFHYSGQRGAWREKLQIALLRKTSDI